jgi:hypothetical protein
VQHRRIQRHHCGDALPVRLCIRCECEIGIPGLDRFQRRLEIVRNRDEFNAVPGAALENLGQLRGDFAVEWFCRDQQAERVALLVAARQHQGASEKHADLSSSRRHDLSRQNRKLANTMGP